MDAGRHAGHATPDGLQHLLARATWDADAVRDDVRDYLAYATCRGHAAIDRELYLPRSWTDDAGRCRSAGLEEPPAFATKPELATAMIERFLAAGHLAAWVAADEVYGSNPKLRASLEIHGIGYVLAIACSTQLATGAGRFRVAALAKKLPKRAWQRLSAGPGAKGQRRYDWAVIDLTEPGRGHRQLLIRRNHRTGELACYRCSSPGPVPLAILVRVAGSRWRVEETFQAGKGLAGLDQHQVRRYRSWLRCLRPTSWPPGMRGHGCGREGSPKSPIPSSVRC